MWILLISLAVLAVVALLSGIVRNRSLQKKLAKGEIDELPPVRTVDAECCGQHEVCERESLLAAVSKQIEYYDDEELDAYRGIPSENYTEEQVQEFQDVFYTMEETDVPGWVRSLQLRGIALPIELRDEVVMVVEELRSNPKR